ncbi:MAG: tRNA 2-selenouridine(34) synthase MnmH [Catalinimonas sp.]
MAHLSASDFLTQARNKPVLDVRAPAEFAHGHIPGARSVPLFTDEERATVGTTYKQVSRDEALKVGLEFVGPKMRTLVEAAEAVAPDRRVLVHCWRGGMRSGSVAWLLQTAGFAVDTLAGGYQGYRRQLMDDFAAPRPLVMLGGETGSGKTAILHALGDLDQAVVDLEGLAHHRGSAFGGIGLPPQPTTEQFHNDLHARWQAADPTCPLWVEDESFSIGTVQVPAPLWEQMKAARVVHVRVPRAARVERLVAEYGVLDQGELAAAIRRIQKRLGPQHVPELIQVLGEGDLHQVADRLLDYYDKSYRRGLARRPSDQRIEVDCPTGDPVDNARRVRDALRAQG